MVHHFDGRRGGGNPEVLVRHLAAGASAVQHPRSTQRDPLEQFQPRRHRHIHLIRPKTRQTLDGGSGRQLHRIGWSGCFDRLQHVYRAISVNRQVGGDEVEAGFRLTSSHLRFTLPSVNEEQIYFLRFGNGMQGQSVFVAHSHPVNQL